MSRTLRLLSFFGVVEVSPTAADIAHKTGSELHVVHARPMLPLAGYLAPENTPVSAVDEEEARERVTYAVAG